MTATFKVFFALLLLLASGTVPARADQLAPMQCEVVAPEALSSLESGNPESPVRLAWQRVGSPVREA